MTNTRDNATDDKQVVIDVETGIVKIDGEVLPFWVAEGGPTFDLSRGGKTPVVVTIPILVFAKPDDIFLTDSSTTELHLDDDPPGEGEWQYAGYIDTEKPSGFFWAPVAPNIWMDLDAIDAEGWPTPVEDPPVHWVGGDQAPPDRQPQDPWTPATIAMTEDIRLRIAGFEPDEDGIWRKPDAPFMRLYNDAVDDPDGDQDLEWPRYYDFPYRSEFVEGRHRADKDSVFNDGDQLVWKTGSWHRVRRNGEWVPVNPDTHTGVAGAFYDDDIVRILERYPDDAAVTRL